MSSLPSIVDPSGVLRGLPRGPVATQRQKLKQVVDGNSVRAIAIPSLFGVKRFLAVKAEEVFAKLPTTFMPERAGLGLSAHRSP